MICPHCSRNVNRKYRYGRRCHYCKQVFALEPKETVLRSHDLRLLKAAGALSAQGTLWYTERQLLWRLARNRLERPIHLFKKHTHERTRLPADANDASVRYQIVERWMQVYGGPPPGLMVREQADELVRQAAPREDSVAIVASIDSDVLGCLAANGVPDKLGVGLLVLGLDGSSPSVPAGATPMLLLRDASVHGCQVAVWWQSQLGPERVRDLTLTVPQARSAQGLPAVQTADIQVDPGLVPDEQDRMWLAQGYQVALAAVPPGRVIARVAKALRGTVVGSAEDHDRTAARMVGFL